MYGKSFMTEVGINALQNGGDLTKVDALDAFANTLNPFRSSLRGRVLMVWVNSLIDYQPFTSDVKKFNYLGNGKNIYQAGFDFSIGLFGEATKYTFGVLGGGNASWEYIIDISLGNYSQKIQQFTTDKE